MTVEKDNQELELHSRIDKIEVTLSHAVDAIEKVASVVNRPQETKWGPILTALALLFAAMAGYTTMSTLPLERESVRLNLELREMSERELERERTLGRIEGLLEARDE